MEQIESKIIYVKKSLLFPHGSMQIKRGPQRLEKNKPVLLYHWNNPLELLFYKKRFFTVGIILDIYEKNGTGYFDIKGIYTAKLNKRVSLFRGVHEKLPVPESQNEEYLVEKLRKLAQQFVFLIDIPESDKLIYLMTFITALSELTDFISHYFITSPAIRKKLYAERDIDTRAEFLLKKLDKMIGEVQKKKEFKSR